MAKIDKTNYPDEVVDVVNEDDKIVGKISRKDLYQTPGLITRSIRVLLYDKDNRILFQKRSKKKKIMPGFWTLGAVGHITSGLSPEKVAPIEMKEELGLKIPLKFWYKSLVEFPDRRVWSYTFFGKYSGEKISVNKDEVDKVAFLDMAEIEKLISSGEEFPTAALTNARKFWEEGISLDNL